MSYLLKFHFNLKLMHKDLKTVLNLLKYCEHYFCACITVDNSRFISKCSLYKFTTIYTHYILQVIEPGIGMDTVYNDIRKAFDKVSQNLLKYVLHV